MPAWVHVFLARIVGSLRDRGEEEDFDVEIHDHLARLTEENARRGMTPEHAARAARVSLGGITQLKEDQRERCRLPWLEPLWQDGRYAVRVFAKHAGFTLVAVLTVAIGIGVNTTVFTLVNAVAFKPLPVADSNNLMRLERWFDSGARGDVQYAFSFEEYTHFRAHTQQLSSLIAAGWPESVAAGDSGEVLQGQVVSGDYFSALGVTAAVGRTFVAEENQVPGGHPVVVLGDACWRSRFQADSQIVGRPVTLNGTTFTIIGVAPAAFIGTGNPPQVPDFWAPLMMQAQLTGGAGWLDRPTVHRIQLLARLKPGISTEQARAELQVLASQLTELPETHSPHDRTTALTLQPAVYFGGTDDMRFAQLVALLMAACSMILLVACANLANMLMARGAARQKEIGMRLALGASRARVVRQLLTENLLLAAAGGLIGLLFSLWASRMLWNVVEGLARVMFVTDRPFLASVTPDGRILFFTIALSIGTGLLFGLSPALKICRSDLGTTLTNESSLLTDRRRPARTRPWLIGGQMAISVAFLVCAGLLLKGLLHSQKADAGFDTTRVFMVFINTGADSVDGAALQSRIVARLIQTAAVQTVALTDRFPFGGTWSPPVVAGDTDGAAGGRSSRTLANYVSSSYFRTMGIPIRWGRTFTRGEEEQGDAVAVVSESAARLLWANQNPLGRRLKLDMRFTGELTGFEVVGVAQDVRSANVSRVDPAYVYLPVRTTSSYNMLVRSDAGAPRVAADVAAAVASVDRKLLATLRVTRMSDGPFLRVQTAIPGIVAPFAAALACMALLLAAIGIYGVTSYVVSQRTREIGIRMALGATARDVQRAILREAMTPVVVGGGLGLAAAAGISRLLQATLVVPSTPDFLFGVPSLDPLTFGGISMFTLLVAAAASYLPARRATKVDPLTALRYE